MKLYFDKFEDELAPNVEEPTTPEYEQEKTSAETEPEASELAPPDEGAPTGDEELMGV